MKKTTLKLITSLIATGLAASAQGQTIITTTYYGDDDGFGVGQTSGFLSSPTISHQGSGEAPYTDRQLIGGSFAPGYPDFAPTGGFNLFTVPTGDTITQVTLTIRTGSFDSGPSTLNPPNRIYLDGTLVNSAFINGFSQTAGDQIETRSINLPVSFFPIFTDGFVSLNGTVLSEDSGSSSFQVDFLRLDITSVAPVPEPSTLALAALGGLSLLFYCRRKSSELQPPTLN